MWKRSATPSRQKVAPCLRAKTSRRGWRRSRTLRRPPFVRLPGGGIKLGSIAVKPPVSVLRFFAFLLSRVCGYSRSTRVRAHPRVHITALSALMVLLRQAAGAVGGRIRAITWKNDHGGLHELGIIGAESVSCAK